MAVAGGERKELYINKISFGYEVDFGHSFYAAGLMFNLSESSTTLTGLLISINNSSFSGSPFTKAKEPAGFWNFKYVKGNNSSNFEITDSDKIKQLDVAKKGTIEIEVRYNYNSAGQYDGTGAYVIHYTDTSGASRTETHSIGNASQFKTNNFGFFSDHWDHGCTGVGYFELTNIDVEARLVEP